MRPTVFRTKLLFAFWGLAIAISVAIGFLTIRKSREALFQQIQSNVLSIAVNAADQVDGDLHEKIQSAGDKNSEAYRQIEKTLRRIRDLNRRDDIFIEFLYTMRPVSSNPDQWIYVVDGEEPGEDKSEIGEPITWESQGLPGDDPLVLGEAYADRQFAMDEYGHWLSAYAPVRTANGNIIAMVGADLRAEDVIAKRDYILNSGLIALAASILIGAVLSIFLSNWATRPLRQITEAVRKIGHARLDARLPEDRTDEFGEVARAFNEMANSLQERDALKGVLSRFISRDIGEQLIKEGKLPMLQGDQQEVTVLFCRTNNTGALAERFSPQTLVEILNDYSEKMVDIIYRNRGTLDCLCGRTLVAVFGAPLADESKEQHAVTAAVEMHAEQNRVNEKWGLTGEEQFRIKLGLHSGQATVGNIGANNRIEFTVVGETVDTTIKIEELNSKYGTSGLVSETVTEPICETFNFREIGDIHPAGRPTILRLFTLREFAKA